MLLAGSDLAFVYSTQDVLGMQPLAKNSFRRYLLLMPRRGHQLVSAADGSLFVMGGMAFGHKSADLIEEFVSQTESQAGGDK